MLYQRSVYHFINLEYMLAGSSMSRYWSVAIFNNKSKIHSMRLLRSCLAVKKRILEWQEFDNSHNTTTTDDYGFRTKAYQKHEWEKVIIMSSVVQTNIQTIWKYQRIYDKHQPLNCLTTRQVLLCIVRYGPLILNLKVNMIPDVPRYYELIETKFPLQNTQS